MVKPRGASTTSHPNNVAFPVDVVTLVVDVIRVAMRMDGNEVADPRIAGPRGRMTGVDHAWYRVRSKSLSGFAEHGCGGGSILDIGEP